MLAFKPAAKTQNWKMATFFRTLRKSKGHTMRSLAAKLGCPHSFIEKIEKDHRRLDVGEFSAYCNALEVDPVDTYAQILRL